MDGHKEWIDTAKSIGCKAIRANLWSEGMKADEVKEISQESLGLLLEYSSGMGMDIVIENHGGFTSDARWVVELMKIINHPNLGTLPDFGTNNFCIERAPKKKGKNGSHPNALTSMTNTKEWKKCYPMQKESVLNR